MSTDTVLLWGIYITLWIMLAVIVITVTNRNN